MWPDLGPVLRITPTGKKGQAGWPVRKLIQVNGEEAWTWEREVEVASRRQMMDIFLRSIQSDFLMDWMWA